MVKHQCQKLAKCQNPTKYRAEQCLRCYGPWAWLDYCLTHSVLVSTTPNHRNIKHQLECRKTTCWWFVIFFTSNSWHRKCWESWAWQPRSANLAQWNFSCTVKWPSDIDDYIVNWLHIRLQLFNVASFWLVRGRAFAFLPPKNSTKDPPKNPPKLFFLLCKHLLMVWKFTVSSMGCKKVQYYLLGKFAPVYKDLSCDMKFLWSRCRLPSPHFW